MLQAQAYFKKCFILVMNSFALKKQTCFYVLGMQLNTDSHDVMILKKKIDLMGRYYEEYRIRMFICVHCRLNLVGMCNIILTA